MGDATRSEVAVFKYIWALSDKRSFVSELFCRHAEGTKFWFSIFAHVLPKAKNKYPHFKLYFGNIKVLLPGEHHLYDNGDEDQRVKYAKEVPTCDWNRLYELRDDLKDLYKEVFPYTYQGIIAYKYSEEEVLAKIQKMNAMWLAEYHVAREAALKQRQQSPKRTKRPRQGK